MRHNMHVCTLVNKECLRSKGRSQMLIRGRPTPLQDMQNISEKSKKRLQVTTSRCRGRDRDGDIDTQARKHAGAQARKHAGTQVLQEGVGARRRVCGDSSKSQRLLSTPSPREATEAVWRNTNADTARCNPMRMPMQSKELRWIRPTHHRISSIIFLC